MKHYFVDSAPQANASNVEQGTKVPSVEQETHESSKKRETKVSNTKVLSDFAEAERGMMSNARMLILGYDLPQIQVVGILKPMQNP